MNFFEIMKYFAWAIEQMRAVDGILILQFPWPYEICIHFMSISSIKNDVAIKSANSELVLCFSFRNTYSYLVCSG